MQIYLHILLIRFSSARFVAKLSTIQLPLGLRAWGSSGLTYQPRGLGGSRWLTGKASLRFRELGIL